MSAKRDNNELPTTMHDSISPTNHAAARSIEQLQAHQLLQPADTLLRGAAAYDSIALIGCVWRGAAEDEERRVRVHRVTEFTPERPNESSQRLAGGFYKLFGMWIESNTRVSPGEMLRTFPLALVLLLAGAVAVASAQQSTSHYGGGYSSRIGAISVYNPSTKHYEPVTWDRQYTYYRLKYHLDQKFFDAFNPDGDWDPTGPTLLSIVISGVVVDNSTGAEVGTWDSSHVSTLLKANQELQYISTLALELGPDGDDTIFISAAFNRANFNQEPTDYESAITGGTGRYKGATGEVRQLGGDLVGFNNVYVAELAVARFKRF